MQPGLQVRNFRWTDIESITVVFNDINGLGDTEKEFDSEFMRQFLSQPDLNPEEHCFVATSDDLVVGFVLIAYEAPIGRAVASGGVLSGYRQQGIGRDLLHKAVSYAGALKVNVIHEFALQLGETEVERAPSFACFFRRMKVVCQLA